MSTICHLHDNEKVEGFPVMLRDDALNFYLRTRQHNDNIDTIIERFRDNYITPEQRARTLITWQTTRLSALVTDNTDKSELQVF